MLMESSASSSMVISVVGIFSDPWKSKSKMGRRRALKHLPLCNGDIMT